jgi:hypothetical protein
MRIAATTSWGLAHTHSVSLSRPVLLLSCTPSTPPPGLQDVMFENPNVVGEAAAFNWTVLDNHLSGSASRYAHAAVRFILDFPGWSLMVPQYLINDGIDMRWDNGMMTPHYGDPKLLQALEQFVTRFGRRYDGDPRLGFVQVGLLGYWGEWHTWGTSQDLVPHESGESLIKWFAAAFKTTQIQTRWPRASAHAAGFGRHDDSFAYNTLDGADNGGYVAQWYFWPDVTKYNQTDFWKRGSMGGETRGEIASDVFEDWYPAGSYEKQVCGG